MQHTIGMVLFGAYIGYFYNSYGTVLWLHFRDEAEKLVRNRSDRTMAADSGCTNWYARLVDAGYA
jgi:hypothetical protein